MEILVIKIVFGSLLGVGGAVLLLLAFLLFYKYMVQEKRCTGKTLGTVKSYTFASRGPKHSGIYLPVVSYNVNGQEYKVIGPEYKMYVTRTKSTPISNNDIRYLVNDQVLHVDRVVNSFFGIKTNPMQQLFPVGSQVDVFYDENKPKLSYVLRYCNKKWCFWLMFISAIALLIAGTALAILI